MARYIDADKIDYMVTMVGMDEFAGYRAVAFESDIDAMPTADVVSKSEVEKWKAICEQLHKEMSERMVEELKIERKLVAREIFGEIDRLLKRYDTIHDTDENYFKYHIEDDIAELKKKYTEEKK